MISRLLALFALSILAFGLGRLAPGDPAEILLRAGVDTPTEEAITIQRERLGLDDPLLSQYARWVGRMVCCLDGGDSFQTARPLRGDLLERARSTFVLAGTAAGLAALLVLVLAVSGAWREGAVDGVAGPAAGLSAALPSYVVGLVLIDVFAVRLGVLPSSGTGSLRHLAMPALTLALATWATPYRLLRSELMRAAQQGFVAAARARGMQRRHIVLRQMLPFALRPTVHACGTALAHLVVGSVVVESVFSRPGLGRWALDAVSRRDYPALQAYVMATGTAFIVINLLTDLLHRRLDPRPSHG